MKPSKRRILSLWRDARGTLFSQTEILKAIGATRAQGNKLRDTLEELEEEGLLRRVNNRYGLKEQVAFSAGGIKAPLAGPPKAGRDEPPRPTGKPPHTNRPAPGAHAGSQAGTSKVPSLPAGAMVGHFHAHAKGFAFVDFYSGGESLFIPDGHVGGALHGDWVHVEHLPRRGRQRTAGRVVSVLRRRYQRLRGRFRIARGQMGQDDAVVLPLNERLPPVFLDPHLNSKALASPPPENTMVEVELTRYPETVEEAPEGRLLRVLEDEENEREAVIAHITSDCALREEFPPAALEEAQRMEAEMLDADGNARLPSQGRGQKQAKREDLRHLPFVTIDGEDAKDFDDAVCLYRGSDGHTRLLVAIADVATYVPEESAVDLEAWERGTSVYFPGRVIPMLPPALSDNLCSLRPHVDRLTLTCEMELDPEGRRVGQRVFPAIIKSQARLTYTRVQTGFESGFGPELPAELSSMLVEMRALANQLRARRTARGALQFVFPETRFEVDESGAPVGIYEAYPSESTGLIEQLMLEANEAVAEICARHELPALYRVHDSPPPDLSTSLQEILWNFGIETRPGELRTQAGLGRVLELAAAHPQSNAVELSILRTMSQARYRASNDGHFALAATHYAHFTSPIRRYPDLVVHRALHAWLAGARPPVLHGLAGDHLSGQERQAGEAEGRVIRLFKVLYMQGHMGDTFAAKVNNVYEDALEVRLRDFPVEGRMALANLPGPRPLVDRRRNLLTLPGKRKQIGLGEPITVALVRADTWVQEMDFAFVAWGWTSGEGEPEAPAGEAPARKPRPHKGEAERPGKAKGAKKPDKVAAKKVAAKSAGASGEAASMDGAARGGPKKPSKASPKKQVGTHPATKPRTRGGKGVVGKNAGKAAKKR